MEFDLYIAINIHGGTKFFCLVPVGEPFPCQMWYEYEYIGRGAFALLGERSVSGSTLPDGELSRRSKEEV